MRLGVKEIAFGAALALAGCENGKNTPQAPKPQVSESPAVTVESLEETTHPPDLFDINT